MLFIESVFALTRAFMSADDSRRLASAALPTDHHDKVEPTVRDALIGAAIGLVLIDVGTCILRPVFVSGSSSASACCLWVS